MMPLQIFASSSNTMQENIWQAIILAKASLKLKTLQEF